MLAGVHRAGINAQNDRPAAAHAYRSGRCLSTRLRNLLLLISRFSISQNIKASSLHDVSEAQENILLD